MRIAVIDMGTNTFHLLIVDQIDGDFKVVYREKIAVKLGKGGISKGKITPDAWGRAIDTLNTFSKVIDEFKAERTYATATSAIRNAQNGEALVKDIKEKIGIDTRIISGIQEAEYIYYGVQKAMTIGKEPALIMDIGGGSIEFILATEQKIHWLQSFEIGGQRLVDQFHHHDPITQEEISNIENYIFNQLGTLFEQIERYRPTTLIGSSGTFDTLSEIHCFKQGLEVSASQTELPLTVDSFEMIFQELIAKNREQRLLIKGMIPLRVDMIVVASVLIKYIVDTCGLKSIRVSAYALKEGVLLSTIDQLKSESTIDNNR